MIKAFIFDLDGVITDTAELHYRAWKSLADKENIPFSRKENDELRGVSRNESLKRLLKGCKISEIQAQEWMKHKNEYYVNALDHLSPSDILPGVRVLLEELKLSETKIALASASKNAARVIRKLKIQDYFDVICDGNSVDNPKPAPDIFFCAAKQLGIEPKTCVVIEDASAGIIAANKAGMYTIGVGSIERLNMATIVVPDLTNIHLQDILERLNLKYFL